MMRGKDAMLASEEFQADRRTGRASGVGAKRVVRRLQDDRRRRVDGGAEGVGDAADAVSARDDRYTFNQLRKRHRNAVY